MDTRTLTSSVGTPQGASQPAAQSAPELKDGGGCAVGTDTPQGVPAPGGAAAPLLDIGCGNVPQHEPRKRWSRKQWVTRRTVLDRQNYWQAQSYQCLWVTLTSSPSSPLDRLRKDLQTLRKRMARQLDYDKLAYVCVDTREVHGVLHIIFAWKEADKLKSRSFYIPFEWLQENWKDIHGAFHVNVKRIGGSTTDARRLSRYLVSQYCGDQDGLVRLSQSKPERPMGKMREALRRDFKAMPERHEFAHTLSHLPPDEFAKELKRALWQKFRTAWDSLIRVGSCELFGVKFVWLWDKLERV